MNNATRTTRREHERALRAEARRRRNRQRKVDRMLTLGRSREQRKPLVVRSREFAIEVYAITNIDEFDRQRADLALGQNKALGGQA